MSQIITLQYNESMPVLFQSDAWINATQIATAFGKKAKDYLKTERTLEYMNALVKYLNEAEKSKGTKILFEQNQLLKVVIGAPETGGGTWMHPKLAIDFARWLSADFAVWCDMQIEKLLQPKAYGLKELPPSTLTTEMKRHVQDMTSVLKHKSGKTHNSIYHDLKTHFNVASYTEIPIVKYADVCAYFGEKPKFTMPELIQCDSRYLASMEQKVIEMEQKAKVLPAPVQKVEPIAEGCVVISIEMFKKYEKLQEKLNSIWFIAGK
jgi:hypothetical protein